MAERIEGFIFARGGSKGVPRKNIRMLGGKPLIAYSVECALACPSLGRVTVSTDDPEIAEIAQAWGADVPFMRPDELANDTVAEWLAWRHAVETMAAANRDFDILVSLPATSPFRAVEDVEACIRVLREKPDIDVALTVRKSERSPYFTMAHVDPSGRAEIIIKNDPPFHRRQDVPESFDLTTVAYAVRTSLIRTGNGLFDGTVHAVEVPAERAMDIDTPYDFLVAELLAEHWKNAKRET